MNQDESIRILKKYSIKIPKTLIFKTHSISSINLKFPLVLKIDSKKIIHKSDMGLVYVNINSISELNRHVKTAVMILKMHNITDYEFVVQEMIRGQEILIGMKTDDTFGKVILFGLGGIFVEVLKDVSMRIAPLSKKDCLDMISEIKGKVLLEGYRNIKKVNIQKIIELLLKISKLSLNEKFIKEIDFNPVIVDEKSATVVDARMIKNV